ncbi:MAG: hypothetical protein JXA33_14190 [Anaerolineae bacterium]|nr:hypothetical protein [Anaerolineae bacterium]
MNYLYTHWHKCLLLTLVIGLSGIYLSIALTTAENRPVAPLDDAYITYQYARQIAQGRPYHYNNGDLPTTGMTSPLFGFLLAGFYRLGIRGEQLPAFAVSLGSVWLGLTAWLTQRITAHLLDKESLWSWAAAILVLLTGALQWSCFNGMETGLFTVLSLAALDAFLKQKNMCTLWLSLAGLTRPEGLILTGILGSSLFIQGIIQQQAIPWRRLFTLLPAGIAGLAPMTVNYVLTGTPSAAGLQAKSWLGNVPFYPWEIAHSIWLSYRQIVAGRFIGKDAYIAPGILPLAVWGWIQMGRNKHWLYFAVTLTWFLMGIASTAFLITALWHLGRYQIPFIPVTIILAIYGLALWFPNAPKRWHQLLLTAILFILTALSLYTTVYYIHIYRRATSTTARQQLVLADWMRENLPMDAIVGIHDAGSLRYVGERTTYDLIGLTTPDAAIPWRHGAGSVYELMEHSSLRPDYFAIYPDAFSIPYLVATDLFAEELFRVNVPDYAVASAGPVQGVWRADWKLADSAVDLYQPDVLARAAGLTLMDTLDVADLDDEVAHNVTWWQAAPSPGFPTEVQQQGYRVIPENEVLDGGRLLTGGIALDVRTQPGTTLWLVARLHARETGAVHVSVNETLIGRWAYPPIPGQWLETVFRVPGEAIHSTQTHIQLEVDATVPDSHHYAPYYFWFLQGEPEISEFTTDDAIIATFAQDLSLTSFDLITTTWHPGDVLPITLHWSTAQTTDCDAKVFLHLYDADGTLGPQSDGWSYYGTRPPYTWLAGETVVDPRQVTLPPDLAPGIYTLEVGLYNNSGRIPAYVKGVRQPEERVRITHIKISN